MVTNDYVTIANGMMEDEFIKRHHKHDVKEHQCSSSLVKHIKAPVPLVNTGSFVSVSVSVFLMVKVNV
jgi:abscisic acid receptor (PYR/PYL family)